MNWWAMLARSSAVPMIGGNAIQALSSQNVSNRTTS
jgi:hypothetical protein